MKKILILALAVSLTVGAGTLIGYGAVLLILHLLTGKPNARNFADFPFWLFATMTVGGALLLLACEVGLPLAAFLFAALALALFLWELIACRGSEEEPIQFRSRGMRMVFITCGTLGLFALLLWVFGFFPAAALFIPFMMYLMGARRPLTFVLLTVGLLVTVFLVFHLLLGVELPMGLLFS